MYRYRLVDEATAEDLGPLISARLTFAAGEMIARHAEEQFEVVNVVEPENDNFRAYVIVRRA
jgi:catalase (peroxidase I)